MAKKTFQALSSILVLLLVALAVTHSTPLREPAPESGPQGREKRQQAPEAPATYEVGREAESKRLEEVPFFRAMRQPGDPVPEPPIDQRIADLLRMTENNRSDDYPFIASNPRNRSEVYAVWVSYAGEEDQLRLAAHRPEIKTWGPWNPVPGVTGDVWAPVLAFDGKDRLWVIWSQREGTNFDLYGRWFDGNHWGSLQRWTHSPESDFNHRVVSTQDGQIHVVWQGFRQGQSDIFYMKGGAGESWSDPVKVSVSDSNDWAPALAVGSDGTVFFVWDTYERGNYDVVGIRSRSDGTWSTVREIAATPRFEADASVAVDGRGRAWVAYSVGPMNWAKDQGATIPRAEAPGVTMLGARQTEVVCLDGDRVWMPAKRLETVLSPSDSTDPSAPALLNRAQLVSGERGQIHLLFHQRHGRTRRAQYWRSWIATMTDQGWAKPATLPFSRGRSSMRASATPAEDGGLWFAWPGNNHPTTAAFFKSLDESVIENVYTARYRPDSSRAADKLIPYTVPDYTRRPAGHRDERGQVARIRAYKVSHQGRALHILRGELHRHTEFSMDGQSFPDGSALDYFRYMLDAASLDFGAMTDHQAGSRREYWWWLSQKLEDIFLAPSRYVSLFAYERSIMFPFGHRNVVYAERGHRAWPLLQDKDFAFRTHIGGRSVLEGDTNVLFEEVGRHGGITIPHTTATQAGGTSWSYNDPKVETVVEIFQGARHSSEHEGAPLDYPQVTEATPIQQRNNAVRKQGYVWNAWEKGYRIGVIASSDHTSTHMSYAMVLTPDRSRSAILEAMKQRRTYAATDNIILEFWLGDHLMGEEFSADTLPPIRVKVLGTNAIARVDIIRNNQYVYHTEPNQDAVEFTYRDAAPDSGLNYYYVRVQQKDNQYAWSSPIWVELK